MSSKNILMECNTVYQLMVASQLCSTIFKEDKCDVVLSDIMNDADLIVERTGKLGFYSNVYLQRIKGVKVNKLVKILCVKSLMKKNCHIKNFDFNKKYDIFLFSNSDDYNSMLYLLLKRVNRKIELFCFEDGLASYSTIFYENNFEKYKIRGLKSLLYYRINAIAKYVQGIYCFSNEYFTYDAPKQVILIPKIKSDDLHFIGLLNKMFDYHIGALPQDVKCIFFEESFYADNKHINDVEIVKMLVDHFGREGFYIKIHPRNGKNRFTDYNVLNAMSIPWELYVLNNMEMLRQIKLITISSSACFTPTLLFGLHPQVYCCFELVDNKRALFTPCVDVVKKIIGDNDNFVVLHDNFFEVTSAVK